MPKGNVILLIGLASQACYAETYRVEQGQPGDFCLFLTDERPQGAFSSCWNVGVVQNDLLSSLLPYFDQLLNKQIIVHNLSPSSGWSLEIERQLPKALEALAYHQMRLGYAPFVNNALLNAAELIHPIIAYSDYCEGKTAVVLGAAPSVEQMLPWLRINRKKVVVFAVARLAKRLQAEHIVPDFLVASDPTAATLAHAERLENFQAQSVLIVQHYVSPVLLEVWQGAVLYWGPQWPQQGRDYQTEANVEIEGGTVANLAVLSALGLGCRVVYCAGMDFCFDETGKTHEGSSLEAEIDVKQEQTETVQNYQGDECDTTLEFLNAVEALPRQLDTLIERYGLSADFELFNINPKAAKIDGVKLVDLKTLVVPEQSGVDVLSLIQSLMVSDQQKHKILQETLVMLQRYQKHYRLVLDLARKGKKLFAKTAEEAMNLKGEAIDVIQKVEKHHRKLDKHVQDDRLFMQRYGFDVFSLVIQNANQLQSHPNDMVWHYRYFKTSFAAYEHTASGLVRSYEKAIRNTQFQLKELKLLNNFTELSALWLAQKRPYRFLGWRQRFPEVAEALEAKKPKNYQMLMESLSQWRAECRNLSQETFAYLSSQPHKLKRQ